MILIVDDLKENILSLKSILELHKFEVDTATSGEEALKKILKNAYALIILDVQMPEMDGFEVAEAISGYSKAKDIPIIFLTAVNTDKKFITRGYKSGAIDYVTKPFDPDILILKAKTFYRLYEQTKELNDTQRELKREIEFRIQAENKLQLANQSLEQKVAERTEDLKQSYELLERKNHELQQFAYISSHDLKEPLRKIQVFGNMLKERFLESNDDAQKYTERIIQASQRMASLIHDVLEYSTLDAPSSFVPTDINELVKEIINDVELSVNETGTTIHVSHLPVVEVIPFQARQLFQNLISNAIKFARQGVAPVINISHEFTAELSVTSPAAGAASKYCRITVADNGIGFDEKYAGKIFSIFQRLHTKDAFAGTGIGLAIVKKIIDVHNGIITATSTLDEGAIFTFVIPLQQENFPYKTLEKTN